tara:strand:- start:45405 stop:45662 length:258 start_codon:yes stop_codon:yes gene_type:complete
MGLAAFNRLRRQRSQEPAQEPESEIEAEGQDQGTTPAESEQQRRVELMDAIEQTTGKRPGANTKTETMEQRLAEIQTGSQDGGQE